MALTVTLIAALAIPLLAFFVLFGGPGCATSGETTWHHPLNTQREVAKDLADCAVQAAQAQFILPNVFDLCMVGRGYSRRPGSKEISIIGDGDVATAKEN